MVACRRSYEVACKMLSGEILYRKGLYDEAYSDLREGVVLEENLPFDEPWGIYFYFIYFLFCTFIFIIIF